MSASDGRTYSNFNYSLNAEKLLNIREDDLDMVLRKYNITPKSLEEIIENIREWYKKQPHLPQGQLHDRMILGQLLTRGFSVEQSKEKIDNYFSVKNKMPEVLCNRDPVRPAMDKLLRQGNWLILPKKMPENQRIIVIRVMNPEDYVVIENFRMGLMLGEYRLFNETTIGDHWVYDFSKAWVQHAMQFAPLIPKLYYHITNCYALKLKGLHFVNLPPFARAILDSFKKIFKAKHVQRMHFYKSFEELLEILPRDVFPKDLGGTDDITCQDVADLMTETLQSDPWRRFFLHQDKFFLSDESKRIGGSNNNDIFGLDGSFRNLDFD